MSLDIYFESFRGFEYENSQYEQMSVQNNKKNVLSKG